MPCDPLVFSSNAVSFGCAQTRHIIQRFSLETELIDGSGGLRDPLPRGRAHPGKRIVSERDSPGHPAAQPRG